MKKFAALVFGVLALAACSQPPVPPAYVERPWTGPQVPVYAGAQYTVLFGFGSAALTKEGKAVVEQAAGEIAKGATSVTLVGHTDTVGNAKANQALSERRAKAVAKALLAKGVPAGAIQMGGVGETDQAVATPDNTKEKANRRVVIVLK